MVALAIIKYLNKAPQKALIPGTFVASFVISGLPLESRCFENNRIFQEDKKTIFAIIKLVSGIFF